MQTLIVSIKLQIARIFLLVMGELLGHTIPPLTSTLVTFS
jgi:hypothetical protein